MALTKDTNSYVDLAEADAYFTDKLDAAAWTDATEEQRNQSLVTATSLLDDLRWTGVVVSDTQALAFPRTGEYFDPRLGYCTELPSTVPERITKATFELAYHLLNNDGLLDDTGRVDNLQLGSINLQDIKSPELIPSHVKRMIKPLLCNGGSRSIWRY